MQENESLRDFVKRFSQAILQVESYNMDFVKHMSGYTILRIPYQKTPYDYG